MCDICLYTTVSILSVNIYNSTQIKCLENGLDDLELYLGKSPDLAILFQHPLDKVEMYDLDL